MAKRKKEKLGPYSTFIPSFEIFLISGLPLRGDLFINVELLQDDPPPRTFRVFKYLYNLLKRRDFISVKLNREHIFLTRKGVIKEVGKEHIRLNPWYFYKIETKEQKEEEA